MSNILGPKPDAHPVNTRKQPCLKNDKVILIELNKIYNWLCFCTLQAYVV